MYLPNILIKDPYYTLPKRAEQICHFVHGNVSVLMGLYMGVSLVSTCYVMVIKKYSYVINYLFEEINPQNFL